MIGSSLRRLIGGRSEAPAPQPPPAFTPPEAAANEPGEAPQPLLPPPPKPGSSHEVGQLMTAISEQSNELQVEFAKISNWSVQLDLLMTRTATMQQILPKFIQTSQDQAAQIEELSAICSRQEREVAGLQTELGHYRPLAMRYEEELGRSRAALDHTQAALAALEIEHGKLQGEVNALLQRLSSSDSRVQRLSEERQVVDQKLLEKSAAAQNLAREVAMLRSDLVAASGENSRLQRDIAGLTEKLSGERESANEAASQAQARIATALQTIKELEAQAAAAAQRERKLAEDLAQRDKAVYDLDIKLSALQSKADFLAGVNQQLRTDLRHHIDHVGTLEHSNRQLIEAMSRNRQATEAAGPDGFEPQAPRRAAGE
jgi:chromosome segregation ATPase